MRDFPVAEWRVWFALHSGKGYGFYIAVKGIREDVFMKEYINIDEMNELTGARHADPHHILGIHPWEGKYYINAYQPFAKTISAVDKKTGQTFPLEKVRENGFFTVELPEKIDYELHYTDYQDNAWVREDPYSFAPVISDLDKYLFAQGNHYQIYEKLGAHIMEVNGVKGVLFAVWAPNAVRVSVVGNFCGWDGRIFPMRQLPECGIFELFIPRLGENEHYKYEIRTHEGYVFEKYDPYGVYAEKRPETASITFDINRYQWQDEEWRKAKEKKDALNAPLAIYELHLGSWRRSGENGFLNYRQIAEELTEYVKDMNYTHVELMPITEHPLDASWGYQVTGYYAPTSRFGTPEDFMYFVDYLHQHGIGVILDWVPAHFPKDAHGLIRFDGTALYEHADRRQGEHPHWGTLIYNYGRNEVKNFLIANALYWVEKYHVDGLRVDAVASMLYLDYGKESGEWIPNPHGGKENLDAIEFFKHLNSIIYQRNPQVMMIAEESTSWHGVSRPTDMGGLGFGFKWNMGWMNDFLRYIEKEPIHRKYHHRDLTFSMIYAYTENFILVLSHDEVVHGKGSMIGKMPGDYWQKFANLRCAYGFMYGHPGKKLLFMGGEFGQFDEWSENKSLDWNLLEYDKHRQLKDYVRDLNVLYRKEPALWQMDYNYLGFEWINCQDSDESIVSFVRKADNPNDCIVVVSNFTPVPKTLHRIGVPYEGVYTEVLNSDDIKYGGSGICNEKPIHSEMIPYDGKEYSIGLKVSPLATIVFKYSQF